MTARHAQSPVGEEQDGDYEVPTEEWLKVAVERMQRAREEKVPGSSISLDAPRDLAAASVFCLVPASVFADGPATMFIVIATRLVSVIALLIVPALCLEKAYRVKNALDRSGTLTHRITHLIGSLFWQSVHSILLLISAVSTVLGPCDQYSMAGIAFAFLSIVPCVLLRFLYAGREDRTNMERNVRAMAEAIREHWKIQDAGQRGPFCVAVPVTVYSERHSEEAPLTRKMRDGLVLCKKVAQQCTIDARVTGLGVEFESAEGFILYMTYASCPVT